MKRVEKREPRLKAFSDRFELLRKERDLSNTDFSKFLEMSRQTVGFYLNGERVPDALTLIKIAEKCNVSVDWLLGLSNAMTQNQDIQSICRHIGLSESIVSYFAKHYEYLHRNMGNFCLIECFNDFFSAPILHGLFLQLMFYKNSEIKLHHEIESYVDDDEHWNELVSAYRDIRLQRFEFIDFFTKSFDSFSEIDKLSDTVNTILDGSDEENN